MDQKFTRWVEAETAKYRMEGMVPGSPRETEILKFWKRHRPLMYQKLMAENLAAKLAFVLDRKRYQAKNQYIQAGMPMGDAEAEARSDWLMMEPESMSPSRPHLAQISTLMTPNA